LAMRHCRSLCDLRIQTSTVVSKCISVSLTQLVENNPVLAARVQSITEQQWQTAFKQALNAPTEQPQLHDNTKASYMSGFRCRIREGTSVLALVRNHGQDVDRTR